MDGKKRKHARKAISRQAVGTRSARHDVAGIRIGNVLDSANKDAQVAPSKRNDGYCRACPRDVLSRRPSKPKETKGQTKTAQHGGIKSVLGRNLVWRVVRNLLSVAKDFAGHDGGKAEETTNDNSEENQAGLLGIKAIYQTKGVRDATKEAEKGTKVDGDVETDEGNDGLGKEHKNRSKSGHNGESLDALAHGRKWRDLQATLLSQTALEDGVKSFSNEAPQGNGEGGEEEHCPLGPTPALVNRNEGTDNRSIEEIRTLDPTSYQVYKETKRLTPSQGPRKELE